MPNKNVTPPFQVFSASLGNQTMTGTNVLTSAVTAILYRDNVSYFVSWTGTPNGTFQVQGSIDYNPGSPQDLGVGGAVNSGTWTTINAVDGSGNTPVASGSPGQILFNLSHLSFPFIRLIYTNSSGSGTLTGWITAKSVGL